MEPNAKIKKLYLDESFNPIIQKNKDGDIVFYSDKKQENIRYELSYHYFFNKLITITQKDKKNQNNRIYSIIQIAFAKIEMLFFFDKLYYINYKKEDNVLLDLYNKMLIY